MWLFVYILFFFQKAAVCKPDKRRELASYYVSGRIWLMRRVVFYFQRHEAPPAGDEEHWRCGDVARQGSITRKGSTVHALSIGIFAISVRPRSLLHTAGTRLPNNSADSAAA